MSRRTQRWSRGLAAPVSVAAHAGVLAAVLLAHVEPPPAPIEPEPMTVALVSMARLMPPPPPPPKTPEPPAEEPPKPAPPKPVKPAPAKPLRKLHISKAPPPPDMPPVPAGKALTRVSGDTASLDAGDGVSEGELAGAWTAGSGPPGRPCDMVQRLERALRRDPDVRAAVARVRQNGTGSSRAVRLWNGDWIRSTGEEGEGLAGVRQAIMVEVGFAP